MDILLPQTTGQVDLGDEIVKDDDAADAPNTVNSDWSYLTWKRLRWSAEILVKHVTGLEWNGEGRDKSVIVTQLLRMKCQAEEVQEAQEEEEWHRCDRVVFARVDDNEEMANIEDKDVEEGMDDSPELHHRRAQEHCADRNHELTKVTMCHMTVSAPGAPRAMVPVNLKDAGLPIRWRDLASGLPLDQHLPFEPPQQPTPS